MVLRVQGTIRPDLHNVKTGATTAETAYEPVQIYCVLNHYPTMKIILEMNPMAENGLRNGDP